MFVFSFGLANFQSTISLFVDHKFGYTPSQIAVIINVGDLLELSLKRLLSRHCLNDLEKCVYSLQSRNCSTWDDWHFIRQFIFHYPFVATSFLLPHPLLRPAVNTLVSKLAGKEQGLQQV